MAKLNVTSVYKVTREVRGADGTPVNVVLAGDRAAELAALLGGSATTEPSALRVLPHGSGSDLSKDDIVVLMAGDAGAEAIMGAVRRARAKLVEKNCDLVVANEVGRPGIGFGADENAVTLVFRDGRVIDLPPARKELLAHAIWDKIAQEFAAPPRKSPNLEEPKLDRKRASRAKGKHA